MQLKGHIQKTVDQAIGQAGNLTDRKSLAASEKLITRASTIRGVGRKVFGFFDSQEISVWGKEKSKIENPLTSFSGWDFGAPEGFDQTQLSLLQALGIEHRGKGIWNYGKETVTMFQQVIDFENSVPKYRELKDADINSGSDHGLLVVGFGDPMGAYGAGPTRDPRRATYAPRLVLTLENISLYRKFGFPKNKTDFAANIAGNIEQNFSLQVAEKGNLQLVSGQDKFYVEFAVKNVTNEKTGKMSRTINADFTIVLTPGHMSGWEFLPPGVRESSPIHGKLENIWGGADGAFAELRKWVEKEISKLKVTAKKISNGKADQAEIVTIYNT